MAISNSSIIHYTKSLDSLKKIFAEGFKVTYCKERITSSQNGHLEGAFPMVCFCDLPLSQIGAHVESYGNYGLGLSKKWARSYGMNPVLYLDKDSELMNVYRYEYERLINLISEGKFQSNDFYILLRFFAYAKNYEEDLVRNGNTITDYRFYNEREWRYVPLNTVLGANVQGFYPIEDYEINKEQYNLGLNHIRLTFLLDDVSYVLVKDESDAEEIITLLNFLYSKHATGAQLSRLYSKIFTIKQILTDF